VGIPSLLIAEDGLNGGSKHQRHNAGTNCALLSRLGVAGCIKLI
jgi:hypothetical protein